MGMRNDIFVHGKYMEEVAGRLPGTWATPAVSVRLYSRHLRNVGRFQITEHKHLATVDCKGLITSDGAIPEALQPLTKNI